MPPTLSLCLIVKNEARFLEQCLASVRGVVDEIVVVDTGSTDDTVAIAARYGARIAHIVWPNDFAQARNAALDLVTTEWVLQLDADQTLEADTWPNFRDALATTRGDGYILTIRSANGPEALARYADTTAVRLFRNRPEHRYVGALHEQILPSILAHQGEVFPAPWIIQHHGHHQTTVQGDTSRHERNRVILEAALAREPDSALLTAKLGMTYYELNQPEAAFACLRRVISELDSRALGAEILHQVLTVLAWLAASRQEFDFARQCLQASLQLGLPDDFSGLIETHARLAQLHAERGQRALAAALSQPDAAGTPRGECLTDWLLAYTHLCRLRYHPVLSAAGVPAVEAQLAECQASVQRFLRPRPEPTGRRLRVAFVFDSPQLGGTEVHILNLCRYLDRARFQAEVFFVVAGGPLLTEFERAGIPAHVYPVHAAAGRIDAAMVERLLSDLRAFDIAHTWYLQGPPPFTIQAPRLAGVPVQVQNLTWTAPALAWPLDAVIVESQAVFELQQAAGVRLPLVRIPPGIDLKRFDPGSVTPRGFGPGPAVGRVSRLVAIKDPESFVRAAALVQARRPEVEFILGGDGPLRPELETLAVELGARVTFTGAVTDTPAFLAGLTLMAYPTRGDSFGYAVAEALAMGLPVISTPTGAIPELVQDNVTGVLVPEGDPAALADAILRLLDQPNLARQLGARARAHLQEHHSLTGEARALEALYSRLYQARCGPLPWERLANSADLLERLLAADDLPAALQYYAADLDPQVLALVRANAGAARADGSLELAEGLDNLAEVIADMLSPQPR